MAITSVGYAGTVGASQWAEMVNRVGGARYSVDDYGSFRVTAAAGTRAVRVAPGGASAYGVYDASDAVVPLTLASVPSGTRWDMVVLRRNWATKTSSVVVIAGGSSKALPARETDPGTLLDQPLALVRVAAGSSEVQEVVDLRCVANNGGLLAWDDLARSYLDDIGTSVRIGDVVWDRVTNAAGSPIWISSDTGDTGWVAVPRGNGWRAVSQYPLQIRRIGSLVELRGAVQVGTGALVSSLATVPAAFRPARAVFLDAMHAGYSNGGFSGQLVVTAAGVVGVPAGYYSGSFGQGIAPIHGMWLRG